MNPSYNTDSNSRTYRKSIQRLITNIYNGIQLFFANCDVMWCDKNRSAQRLPMCATLFSWWFIVAESIDLCKVTIKRSRAVLRIFNVISSDFHAILIDTKTEKLKLNAAFVKLVGLGVVLPKSVVQTERLPQIISLSLLNLVRNLDIEIINPLSHWLNLYWQLARFFLTTTVSMSE